MRLDRVRPALPGVEGDHRRRRHAAGLRVRRHPDRPRSESVLFKASLKGGGPHELRIADASGQTVGAIPSFGGTATKELAVELPAGTYTAVCLLSEGARTHADLGMKQTFTVSARVSC